MLDLAASVETSILSRTPRHSLCIIPSTYDAFMLRLITFGLILLLGIGIRLDGSETWYQTLESGITRGDVHKMAGAPNAPGVDEDRYDLSQRHIVVQYHGDAVVDCTYFQPPGGGISESLYFSFGGEITEPQLIRRRLYLAGHDFAVLPNFDGPAIRTSGESGICYPIEHFYIVVEPIVQLMGGMGFFTDKAAMVSVFDCSTGKRTVVYRAIEHWDSLRPPQLSKADADARLVKLRTLG